MLSSACLRDSTASVHIFCAEQEQLRGKKCLVVLVGQKEGHMIRYGQKENKNERKNIVWKKKNCHWICLFEPGQAYHN